MDLMADRNEPPCTHNYRCHCCIRSDSISCFFHFKYLNINFLARILISNEVESRISNIAINLCRFCAMKNMLLKLLLLWIFLSHLPLLNSNACYEFIARRIYLFISPFSSGRLECILPSLIKRYSDFAILPSDILFEERSVSRARFRHLFIEIVCECLESCIRCWLRYSKDYSENNNFEIASGTVYERNRLFLNCIPASGSDNESYWIARATPFPTY